MTDHDQAETDRWVDEKLAALASAEGWPSGAADRIPRLHARRAALRARRLRWATLSIAAAIVFVAVPVTRAFGTRCLEACANATSRITQFWRADEPAAAMPRAVGANIGDLAPDVVGTDMHGAPIRLSTFRGQIVVLNFWATWCGPCRAEIPVLNDLQARFSPRDLKVIGVSLDEAGWSVITPFADDLKVSYALALSDDGVSAAFGGLNELPVTFVIDRTGRIVIKRTGVLSEGAESLPIAKLIGQ